MFCDNRNFFLFKALYHKSTKLVTWASRTIRKIDSNQRADVILGETHEEDEQPETDYVQL